MTDSQRAISQSLADLISQGKSVLLEAVCGAGKTELVYQTIAQCLNEGKKVGFAIARRQVVLEIAERLASVFSKLKVVAVCQGYTDDIDGDLIVCTTHQLYRFNQYFDLLIIDEPDAFPYKGNIVLQGFAQNSCIGSFIYLTATPDDQLLQQVLQKKLDYLYLAKRPSGKDLIVPKVHYCFGLTIYFYLFYYLYQLLNKKKPLILFVPSIYQATSLYMTLRIFVNCCMISSKVENKDAIINDFKNKKYDLCISTTVLERGVTIADVNVIVFKAENRVFDQASLVQCSGRVGRNVKNPYGDVIFLASYRCEAIDKCIERIERANRE